MRLFIALDFNSRFKDLIEAKIKILKKSFNNQIKWVDKARLHLTVKFIGKASVKEKEKIVKSLKEFEFKNKNNYIQFNQLTAFPTSNNAKIIYLGLGKGENIVKNIYQTLESDLIKKGFEADKRDYIPHLTLARVKETKIKIPENYKRDDFINIFAKIKNITVYQSILKAAGPEYIKLFSI